MKTYKYYLGQNRNKKFEYFESDGVIFRTQHYCGGTIAWVVNNRPVGCKRVKSEPYNAPHNEFRNIRRSHKASNYAKKFDILYPTKK